MIFRRTMQLLQREITARFEVSSTIRHRGEKGRQREDGYAMFLREYLPERYGVATGEIVPYTGDLPSPQCDVIIYDRLSFPVIGKYTRVQQVPLEAVYSVTEVKSRITKADIGDARAKFDAIRKLPRCERKNPSQDQSEDRPFFVLFGYRLGTTIEACAELVGKAPNRDTVVIALDSGIIAWALTSKGTGPTFFGDKNASEAGASHTLCLALVWHLEWLADIDLGSYRPLELFLST